MRFSVWPNLMQPVEDVLDAPVQSLVHPFLSRAVRPGVPWRPAAPRHHRPRPRRWPRPMRPAVAVGAQINARSGPPTR